MQNAVTQLSGAVIGLFPRERPGRCPGRTELPCRRCLAATRKVTFHDRDRTAGEPTPPSLLRSYGGFQA
jgi:hypothetical protein